jgi:hypothetical protein
MNPRCVFGIVGAGDPTGGFWVVRSNLVGVWPMDLVPLDIMLSVEAFGNVWF